MTLSLLLASCAGREHAPAAHAETAPVAVLHRAGDANGQSAAAAAQSRCGDAAACFAVGHALSNGEPRDYLGTMAAYRSACDQTGHGLPAHREDLLACVNLGILFEQGRGAPVDEAGAAALYARACDAGEAASGCGMLGAHDLRSAGSDSERARARALLRRACAAGNVEVCRMLDADEQRSR